VVHASRKTHSAKLAQLVIISQDRIAATIVTLIVRHANQEQINSVSHVHRVNFLTPPISANLVGPRVLAARHPPHNASSAIVSIVS
jgi:hypothetical protein